MHGGASDAPKFFSFSGVGLLVICFLDLLSRSVSLVLWIMDATEIARLCEDLPLEEEDGAIHEISEDIQREGFGEVYHCLVGKILSGKKVNRDAFRGFIEHLWNPFGGVEIEVVGDNVFMFYFKNLEDRNRVWQRGPWHFDKCLIVLEKPEGVGDIKKLKFNKAEFWVQIHDIPIMCMNRRTAKWLAEQIGEVLDLPIDSKECRGKFLKVKVMIDISRPLKRWLRLKLDSSENIVVVGLKYERLPEFCYVCGRVGHNSRDCPDEDARLEALKASSTKYGAWLRATNPERSFFRNSQQDSGHSSGRSKSLEGSREMEEERSLTSRSRPPVGPITPPNRSYPSTIKISSNSCSCRLSISMASSSTPPSTVTLTKKYDVFLSFRGPDTRVGFTSHLHDALSRKCMVTFIDFKLERGDEISPALLKSIQESMIAVVIFSKEYASSKWCLRELAEIMKCKKLHGLIVLPVFYYVNPFDVRYQTGPFNDSFAEHENESQEEVQEWRKAFTEASKISGWDYAGTRSEAELVRIIVEDVQRKLMSKYISPLSDFVGLIGMHKRIEQVMPLLCLGTMDVRSIGIWGMGASGKTTLAEVLFNQISGQFDGSCFIEEVEERLENRKSNCLRLEVLSKVLHEVNLELATPTFLHPFIKQRLTQKKVLIVFDGVSKFWRPLETLINDLNRCDSGSRIIIISRDKHVLYNYKVPDCNIYEVEGFNLITAKQENVTLIELFTPEQVREHIRDLRQWVGQSKKKAENNQAMEHAMSENSCSLCAVDTLNFEPPPIYCTQCGPRIKRNAIYYTMGSGATQPYFCISCYNEARGETIVVDGISIPKARLEKKKNDKETEEWWVQCYKCEAWQHHICALFNGRKKDGDAEYTCPNCYIEEVERGERKPLPQSAVLGAKDLPRTILSDHIEQRLFKRLKQERLERARFQGKSYDEVLGVESLVIRVVSSVDKKLEVKQQFLEIFQEENYPTEFPYKSKVVLLFQKIEGVEVSLFGMYVQEFGSECQFPNQRRVYLSYLDSVKYFRPEIKAVTGEALSTFVYHEILIGYLEYCKLRGFTSCYIWACPPPKGEDYILYCHPEIQKTAKSDKLREWYLCMLRKAAGENIVVYLTNLYDHFFVPTGESRAKVTAARLPYFDGDYWPGAAEDLIYQIRQEEDGKKQNKKGLTKKTITKRALKASGQTDLSGNASKDLLLMHKLGETICPMKEDFIMVHLQHACTHCCILMVSGTCHVCRQCRNFQLCDKCFEAEKKREDRDRHPINLRKVHPLEEVSITDVPADTKDRDEILESEYFDTRLAFLSLCQGNYYQYDTLRRAKHSSMMVLYHLHNPTAPAFVTVCIICHLDIETGQVWRCEVCQNYDVCNTCYQKDGVIDHPHKLTNHPSNADCAAQNKEARQLRVVQLRKMLDLLVHASQCLSSHCQYPNCRKVKGLYRHGIQCKTRASGGCALCKKMWYHLQLHAQACKESECPVPRCRDLKEHLRRLQQQSDSRRRAAVMEMMRQRAAEVAGNAAEVSGGDQKRWWLNGSTAVRG